MLIFNKNKSLTNSGNTLLRVIKMTTFFSFLGLLVQGMLFSFLFALPAASGQGLKDVNVTISAYNVTFEQILKEIEDKTDFKFFYVKNEVPLKEKVTIDVTNESLYNLLRSVAGQYRLVFQRINNQIIIKKSASPQSEKTLVVEDSVKIKGRIIDASTKKPLPGANAQIVSLHVGAATDLKGNYSFNLPSNIGSGQTIQVKVSYIGYKPQTKNVVIAGNTVLVDFALEPDIFLSNQIVVTGIASKRAKSVAEVSVARVDAEKLTNKQVYTTFNELISGKVSGVQVTQTSGTLGSGFRFFVRGGGGLNGNGQPIIFIDGVRADNSEINLFFNSGQTVSNMATVDPDNIANIEVLKGPAAAGMYGTDASNGVVLITTKTGQLKPGGGISFNYKFVYGNNEPGFKYDPNLYFNADIMNNGLLRTGLLKSHYFNVSGGNSFIRYFASYQRKNEEGITGNNYHTRNAGRINLTSYPSDKLVLKINASYSQNALTRPLSDDAVLGYNWAVLMFAKPFRLYDSVAVVNTKNRVLDNRFIGSGQITWTPIKNLTIFGNFGIDRTDYREDETLPQGYRYWLGTIGRRIIATTKPTNYSYDFNVKYFFSPLKDLSISSVFGAQLFERQNRGTLQERRGFSSPLLMDIQAGSDLINSSETAFNSRQAGIYTSHTLSYQDRFFATLGLRQDYASAVGQNAPSIIYPQASFAVRLDKFGFFPDLFNLFKFRTAYGESGQLPLLTDTQRLLYTAGGTAYGTGAIINSVGNTAIEPERVKEFEVGLDMEFLNNYSLETTYYRTYVSNSILGVPSSPSSGFGGFNTPENVGTVKGYGIELLFQANPIRTQNFDLSMSFIWNWQKNEVTDLAGLGPLTAPYAVNVDQVGMPRHEFFAYRNPGAKFDAKGVYAGPQDAVRTDLGNPIPDNTGSFTLNIRFFKNFSLYGLADWAIGNKVFSILRDFAIARGGYKPYYVMAAKLGLTQYSGTTPVNFNDYKPLTPGTPEYIALANQFAQMDPSNRGNFIYDADFFAIRELSLTYDFTDLLKSTNIISRYIKGIRTGFSVRNLLRISKYKDGDFEVNAGGGYTNTWGVDYGTLPQFRVYSFFLQVSI